MISTTVWGTSVINWTGSGCLLLDAMLDLALPSSSWGLFHAASAWWWVWIGIIQDLVRYGLL